MAPVGLGQFTVSSDLTKLGPVIETLLDRRKAQALADDDLLTWRMLHVHTASVLQGTGVVVERDSLVVWLKTMRFDTPLGHGDRMMRKTGLTPLVYALIAGREDLVAQLIDAGAPLKGTGNLTKEMVATW